MVTTCREPHGTDRSRTTSSRRRSAGPAGLRRTVGFRSIAQAVASTTLLASVLMCSPRPLYAQGGPPLLTDDPGTPGDDMWETNIGFTIEKVEGETLYEAPLLDVNYGLGERIQLKYELPWVFLDEEGGGVENGLGNSLIGLKYRFLDEDRHGVSMSSYPQFSFENPTSSDEKGLVAPGIELVLPFQIAWSSGPIELGLELGYSLIEHEEDEWIYGLAAASPLTEHFALLGEVHGVATRDLDDDVLVFNLGSAVALNEHASLLFSAGRSLREPSTTEPELLMYMGLQLVF
ncbi:MAG: transporter [Planctomycetota bacterium]